MNKVVLGVGAHPDDMDFTASGTIAKLIEEGWEGYYLICTDGSAGSRHHDFTHKGLAEARQEEQLEAAKILGLKNVFFLDHRDTKLVADELLKAQIVRIIREVRPNLVITMDPNFLYTPTAPWSGKAFINHTDHRAAGIATMDAVFPLSRDRLSFPEHERQGLKPHKVDEIWFTSFDKTAHVVDVTSTFDKKIRALACHKSQFDDFPMIEKEARKNAVNYAKNEEYTLAESFIKLVLD